MPVYEYVCGHCGEVFDVLFRTQGEAAAGARPSCPACSAAAAERVVSSFAMGNRVDVGPGRSAYPYTWEQTRGGDPEVLAYWRKRIEKEQREELNDPELRMRRDEVARRRSGQEAAPAHGHEHPHAHPHPHGHGHAHPHPPAPSGEPSPISSHDEWKYVQFVRPKDDRNPRPPSGGGPGAPAREAP
jgi:putative FmdB family regulatory protein